MSNHLSLLLSFFLHNHVGSLLHSAMVFLIKPVSDCLNLVLRGRWLFDFSRLDCDRGLVVKSLEDVFFRFGALVDDLRDEGAPL
jgi:hypothetical protein